MGSPFRNFAFNPATKILTGVGAHNQDLQVFKEDAARRHPRNTLLASSRVTPDGTISIALPSLTTGPHRLYVVGAGGWQSQPIDVTIP